MTSAASGSASRSSTKYTKHLHIVINDPNKHGGHAVVVNATKNETLSGGELIVTNTDHPWLDYDKSWIA